MHAHSIVRNTFIHNTIFNSDNTHNLHMYIYLNYWKRLVKICPTNKRRHCTRGDALVLLVSILSIFFYTVIFLNVRKIWTGDDSNQGRGGLTRCDGYHHSRYDVRAKLRVHIIICIYACIIGVYTARLNG
jgi:hypothetical protein